MAHGIFPRTDAGLLAWSLNLKTLITANPTDYGLVAADAVSYGAKHDAYASALSASTDPITRTKGKIATKDICRKQLKDEARLIVAKVFADPDVTVEQKIDLRLNPRDVIPTPIPAPTIVPGILILAMLGRMAKIQLVDPAAPTRRAKPPGVGAAMVYTFIGQTPPTDPTKYTCEGFVTRTTVDVQFPADTAPGTKVWFSACWANPRGLTGPSCEPISAFIAGGAMGEAA